jgi:hypothetical protein
VGWNESLPHSKRRQEEAGDKVILTRDLSHRQRSDLD